ncbi:uncharacterized protein LOC112560839 isoform X1 [Pomacea canaliculata]|uniref:uncharacterized protein LOC112560839 isoform X1 n=1 Tax=Pomacea canaliculata TaxID=400727 RepID=UPI000D72C791|nr:uncharacterized protein LOC112560839 isoform X1 [Pomacea canaliculata]XP_025088699.1 uncharacterized protein LOC112560839 isoform X1 [Pomacea canaliculata]XP_025088701.1 uncharacterized protein LOC112560839 isoform X1 [Pomacea canaliculata]XP_025088702.1 uncharacterized protein LOC112560839 isoform X1 [Pomacea canaliculata]
MLLWMTIAFCWMTVGLACDCMPHREDNYCNSDVVFRGEAVAEHLGETSEPYPWEIRIYTVNVEEIFWSNSSFVGMTTFNLTTQRSSAMCGVRFSLNTAYVIAASERNGQLVDSSVRRKHGLEQSRHETKKVFHKTPAKPLCLNKRLQPSYCTST